MELKVGDKVTLINPFKEQKMINIFSKEDYKDNYIQVNYNNKPIIYVSPILLQGRVFKDIKDLNDNCLNKYGYNIIEEIDWSKVERGTRLYLLDSLDKRECLAFGTYYTFEEFRDGKVVANRVLVVEYKQVGVKEFDVNDVYIRE